MPLANMASRLTRDRPAQQKRGSLAHCLSLVCGRTAEQLQGRGLNPLESEFLIVFVTAGSVDEAEYLAQTLVREKLAACANVLPGVSSVYHWAGALQSDSETLMILKTRRSLLTQLSDRVQALHSYEVPEIVALPIIGGSVSYLRWLAEATAGS